MIKYILYFIVSIYLIGFVIAFIGFVFVPLLNSSKKNKEFYNEYNKTKKSEQDTFFFDIDGTILPYIHEEELDQYIMKNQIQELLPGVKDFFEKIGNENVVIFTSGRREKYREITERTLRYHNIKYRYLIMDLPIGKRYLVNDTTNMFYQKAIGINLLRNMGLGDITSFNPKI
jgi:Ca2+/Na+ antiporter